MLAAKTKKIKHTMGVAISNYILNIFGQHQHLGFTNIGQGQCDGKVKVGNKKKLQNADTLDAIWHGLSLNHQSWGEGMWPPIFIAPMIMKFHT